MVRKPFEFRLDRAPLAGRIMDFNQKLMRCDPLGVFARQFNEQGRGLLAAALSIQLDRLTELRLQLLPPSGLMRRDFFRIDVA